MSQKDATLAIRTRINDIAATWVDYPVVIEYDNRKSVNYPTQTNPWLRVKMVYQDGEQASLGPTADSRVFGTIVLEAMDKAGNGSDRATALLEHFYPQVHQRDDMPPVRCLAARLVGPTPDDNLMAWAAVIPFWYDRAFVS